ncbi:MAG: polysaccharide deacetylase family protein [Cytophagaceae bacterium]
MRKTILATLIILSNTAFGQTSLRYRVTPWSDNKKAAITVTLDDNCSGQFTYALPIMNARNIKGTFYVITGDGYGCSALNWNDYKNAAAAGHEVTSHTVTHPDLATLSSSQIRTEMQSSQQAVIANVPGQKSQTFAYPYGSGGGGGSAEVNVRTIAHDYFIGSRGAGVNPSGFDEYNDYRNTAFQDYYFQVESYEVTPSVDIQTFKNIVNAVIVDGGWFIPQYHGIQTPGGYDNITSTVFTAQMDALAAKSSQVWLATFAQTLKYHREHDSQKLAVVSEDASAWTLNLTDNLPNASYDQPLTIRMKKPSWTYTSIKQGSNTLNVITDGDTLQFNAVPDGGNIVINKGVTGPSVATNSITGSPFCAGAPVIVPFTVSGTFNSGNIFTAQISDATGSFASPVTIGTLTGTASSSISANLPSGISAGNAYRIRVIASSPSVTGTDNGTNIIVNTLPVATISSSTTTFCTGGSVTLTANTGTGLSYQWSKDGTVISGATASSYSASVAGSYTVKETNGGGCSSVSNSISITENTNCTHQAQTINFPAIPAKTYTSAPFRVTATASSGLPVSFSIVSGPATISVDTVKVNGVGTVVVRASQAGNTSYDPAPTVDNSFTVSKASQSIVFPVIPNKKPTDPPFNITASASSGLPITFSIVSGPATISGNTITLKGTTGTVTVKATQAGNANYNPVSVNSSFTVGKQTQTINFPQIPDHEALDDPFQLKATASSGLTVTFEILSGPADIEGDNYVYLWEYAGDVVVRAKQAGNTQYAAAHVDQTFHVYEGSPRLAADSSSLLAKTAAVKEYSVFPNPAHDILKIKFDQGEDISAYTYSLQTSGGEKIDGIAFTPDKEAHITEVDIRLLAPGIYYLFIYGGSRTRMNKILKE